MDPIRSKAAQEPGVPPSSSVGRTDLSDMFTHSLCVAIINSLATGRGLSSAGPGEGVQCSARKAQVQSSSSPMKGSWKEGEI